MPSRTRDLAAVLLLAAAGLGILVVFRRVFGLVGALGSDPALWLFSAYNVEVGAAPVVPPLFPGLVALVRLLPGVERVGAALLVSGFSYLALAPAVFLVLRRLGCRVRSALIAASLLLACPSLAAFGVEVQPDATTALMFALVPAVAVAWIEAPSAVGAGIALAALAGLAPLLREHGVILALGILLLIPFRPGPRRARMVFLAGVVAALLLGPCLFHELPEPPWACPWQARVRDAVVALVASDPGTYADRITQQEWAALDQLHKRGDWMGIILTHALRALRAAPAQWAWLGIGITGALLAGRRRLVLLLPLVTALPALIIWSQPRHVAVVLPAIVVAATLGIRALPRRGAVVGAVVLLGAAVPWGWGWRAEGAALAEDAWKMPHLARFGAWLCSVSAPDDLVAGPFPEVTLWCPRPRTFPRADGDAADWRTWWIHSVRPHTGWEQDMTRGLDFPVWRLRPDLSGDARPCAASAPPQDWPGIMAPDEAPPMDPPCRADPPIAPAAPLVRGQGHHPPLPFLPGRPLKESKRWGKGKEARPPPRRRRVRRARGHRPPGGNGRAGPSRRGRGHPPQRVGEAAVPALVEHRSQHERGVPGRRPLGIHVPA